METSPSPQSVAAPSLDDVGRKPGAPHYRLCIVTPCFNEEAVLPLFYRNLKAVLGRMPGAETVILFVDDGSTDTTLQILNQLAATDDAVGVVSLSRNFGHQIAITAGLDYAVGDAILMMDSDLQHPPELIPLMVQKWQEGFDVVSAIRQTTKGASFLKRQSSSLFYLVFNALSEVKVPMGAADFCLLSERAKLALQSMPERHRLLRGMISWIGFRRALLSYEAPERAAGSSKYNLIWMESLALDGVSSFSAAPVRLAFRVGVLIITIALVYFCYILYAAFRYGDVVRGWSSLVVVILGMGGSQLFFIGIIGEYLSRLYEEGKHRPLYFVKQEPRRPSV